MNSGYLGASVSFLPFLATRKTSRPPASDQGGVRDAVREQLGLKLEPTRAPVDLLVITSIERPTAN